MLPILVQKQLLPDDLIPDSPETLRDLPLHRKSDPAPAPDPAEAPVSSRRDWPKVTSYPPTHKPADAPDGPASPLFLAACVAVMLLMGGAAFLFTRASSPELIATQPSSSVHNPWKEKVAGSGTATSKSPVPSTPYVDAGSAPKKKTVRTPATGTDAGTSISTEVEAHKLLRTRPPAIGYQFTVTDWKMVHEQLMRGSWPSSKGLESRVIVYTLWILNPIRYDNDFAKKSMDELAEAYLIELRNTDWQELGQRLHDAQLPRDGGVHP